MHIEYLLFHISIWILPNQLKVLVRKFNSLIGFEAVFLDYVESFICQCIILIRLNKYTWCFFLQTFISTWWCFMCVSDKCCCCCWFNSNHMTTIAAVALTWLLIVLAVDCFSERRGKNSCASKKNVRNLFDSFKHIRFQFNVFFYSMHSK